MTSIYEYADAWYIFFINFFRCFYACKFWDNFYILMFIVTKSDLCKLNKNYKLWAVIRQTHYKSRRILYRLLAFYVGIIEVSFLLLCDMVSLDNSVSGISTAICCLKPLDTSTVTWLWLWLWLFICAYSVYNKKRLVYVMCWLCPVTP